MVEPVPAAGDRQPDIGAPGAFAGFAPWIVYACVAKPSTWEWAALAALVAALILAVPAVEDGYPRLLDVGAIGVFGAIATLGLLLDRTDLAGWSATRSRFRSGAGADRVRHSAVRALSPRSTRETPLPGSCGSARRSTCHVVLSAAWAGTFALTALVCAYGETTGTAGDLLDWVVPVGLVAGLQAQPALRRGSGGRRCQRGRGSWPAGRVTVPPRARRSMKPNRALSADGSFRPRGHGAPSRSRPHPPGGPRPGRWDAIVDGAGARLAPAGGSPNAVLSADADTWEAVARDLRGGMQAFGAGRLSVRRNLHLGVGLLAATSGMREEGRLEFCRAQTRAGSLSYLQAGTGPAVASRCTAWGPRRSRCCQP